MQPPADHVYPDDLPLAPLLPPPGDDSMQLLHLRDYAVEVYRASGTELVARGAVRDVKPGGLYLTDDLAALPVHHMVVELRVEFPSLTITSVTVEFRTYPERECPAIIEHYDELVGRSIARGFTHQVRESFGGPRGCSHTTALLQAMAPTLIQATFSMNWTAMLRSAAESKQPTATLTPADRRKFFSFNVNACHAWDENGSLVASLDAGRPPEVPVFIEQRFRARGRDPESWRRPRA